MVIALGVIAAVIFGGIEIVNLIMALIHNPSDMECIAGHLEKVLYCGVDLAILFIGYVTGKRYFDNVDIDEVDHYIE